MSKLLWKTLAVAPVAAGLAFSGAAMAATGVESQPQASTETPVQLAQITSVSQLSDVQPSDWAFQALRNLVETYGCIQGYPDSTFKGSRSLTRYEFAAGLNACLDVMAVLISQSAVNPDDIAAIRRLQEEYQAELAILRGRVDALEAETATLRAQQFSTTTKLRGQADMHLVMPFDKLETPVRQETSVSVATRARLNFDSSFTGRDRLRIRLQGAEGNAIAPATLGGLNYASGGTYSGASPNLIIDDFYYRFPLANIAEITVAARGLSDNDWVSSTILPFDGPGVADASTPAFYNAGGSSSNSAGLGIGFDFGESLALDFGYSAGYPGAANPSVGVFAASNQSYIAQLSFIPKNSFLNAGIAYLHNDRSATFAGGAAGATNTYAGLLNLDFGSFFVAGYGAYTDFNGGNDFNWTAGAGFDDFLLEGSKFGVYGGQLPQLVGSTSNPFLVEGYYQIPFSKYLSVTPAIIYGDAKFTGTGDSTGLWGVLRATFRF
jgi:hypothetical protein